MAPKLKRVAVGTFGGVSALPLRVAESAGFLEAAGLRVERLVTRDSAQLRDQLVSGELDIVHAVPDNVIAWTDGGDVASRAWLAGSNGPITLVARDGAELADLRGSRVAVDSPKGGFAPILRRLLTNAGLASEDVELVPMGATRLRYTALIDATVDATMLTLPWSLLAAQSGARAIADHTEVAPDLLTSCAASTAEWLGAEVETTTAYAQALDAALAWLRDARHRDDAVGLLADDMDLETEPAGAIVDVMRTSAAGWPNPARLRGHELAATWQLRAETMARPDDDAEAYVHALEEPT